MKRPRTIFGPFVLAAMLGIGFALGRMDRPAPPTTPAPAQQETAETTVRLEPPRAAAGERIFKSTATTQQRLRARLMIPVAGVTRDELRDTWGHARSEGRTHQGIDIMAPEGAAVVAVADGRIAKFHDSVRGGVGIYQFDHSGRFVFFYGHLSARAAGLLEGDEVRQGQTIGYVGMTGNAPVPHLHFEVQRMGDQQRWYRAEAFNPYPLLMTGAPPA